MKKTTFFILIVCIVLIFASCINSNHAKSTIKLSLKGNVIKSLSKTTYENLWNQIKIEFFNSYDELVLSKVFSKDVISSDNILEFTDTNLIGNYTINITLYYSDSPSTIVARWSGEQNLTSGLNSFDVNLEFNTGRLRFNFPSGTIPDLSYNVTVKSFKDNSFSRTYDLTESSSFIFEAGNYMLYLKIYEKNNLVWANDGTNNFSDSPYAFEILPGQEVSFYVDTLSKNVINVSLPFIKPITNPAATQVNGTTNVKLTWDFTSNDNKNEIFYIYKKCNSETNYRLVVKTPVDNLTLFSTGTTYEYTDSTTSTGTFYYKVNVIDSNKKESGFVNFDSITVVPPEWQVLGTSGISDAIAEFPLVKTDSNNVPYILYRNYGGANHSQPSLKKFINNQWIDVGNNFQVETSPFMYSLAIDSSNIPYVSFIEYIDNNNCKIYVKKLNDNSWTTLGNGPVISGNVYYPYMTMDSEDNIYIAYRDNVTYGGKVAVKKYNKNSDTWELIGNGAASDGTSDTIMIKTDRNNDLYLFCDDYSYNMDIHAKKYNKNTNIWENLGTDGKVYLFRDTFDVAFDKNNIPYFICNDGTVKIFKFDNSQWTSAPDFESSFMNKNYPKIVAGSDGSIYAFTLYSDSMDPFQINYSLIAKKLVNDQWINFGVDNVNIGGDEMSMYSPLDVSIDSYNNPVVVYNDGNLDKKATVITYK